MSEPRAQTAPRYTEAQAMRWLAWLARGMHEHGQAVFLIENLQPSWLPTWRQRRVYLVVTRLLFGLLTGLLFGIFLTLFFGFHSGVVRNIAFALTIAAIILILIGVIGNVLDNRRLGFEKNRIGRRARKRSPRHHILYWVLGFGLLGGLLGWPFFEAYDFLAFFGLLAGVFAGFIWTSRVSSRTLANDIMPVETIHWSWKQAAKVALFGGLLVGLPYIAARWFFYDRHEPIAYWSFWLPFHGMMIGLSVALVFGVIGGYKQRIRDLRPVANQGIRLSIRSGQYAAQKAAIVGLLLGWPVSLGNALVSLSSEKPQEDIIQLWLPLLPLSGLVFGLSAFLWHGGMDAIQHYILRYLLARQGSLPRKLIPFLDYAAEELNFLQKVGGGYMFIHRYLLEHFAAMDTTEWAPFEQPGAPEAAAETAAPVEAAG